MICPPIGANTGLTRDEVYALSQSLAEKFGYWDTHPDFPLEDWQHEVANDYTRYGYWMWVAKQLDEEAES